MKEEREIYYEDEISLYDIWDTVIKYKKQILTILVVGFILSFGGALVARKYRDEYTTQEYRIRYAELESNPYYKMARIDYTKFNPKVVVEDEEYIDRFLAVPSLKKLYDEQKPANPKEILYNKRKFIKQIINIKDPEKGEIYKTANVTLKDGVSGAPEILAVYFDILKEEIPGRIVSLLDQRKIFTEKNHAEAKIKLEGLEDEIDSILSQKNFKVTNRTDMISLLALEKPMLTSDIELYKSIYAKTTSELLGINFLQENSHYLEKLIDKKETLFVERGSSKAKIVLLAGVFISFALAFMYVFISEMKIGYKKHKEEKEKLMLK